MKVIHLCNSDSRGGAARAARRLSDELIDHGIDSSMFVIHKHEQSSGALSPDSFIRKVWRKGVTYVENLLLRGVTDQSFSPWSISCLPTFNVRYLNKQKADVIHIHWLNKGLLSIPELKSLNAPIVWTLHDQWPFEDGRHYRMENANDKANIYTRYFAQKKIKAFQQLENRIWWVCLNKWMEEGLAKSELCPPASHIRVINNPISDEIFHVKQSLEMREKFNIPQDSFILLYGAINSQEDRRKGGDLLADVILKYIELTKGKSHLTLLQYGTEDEVVENYDSYMKISLGRIHSDEMLAKIYNVADAFICPSRLDNQPNTINEAMHCGLRVLSFDVGGISEMIIDENQVVVSPFDTEAMAQQLVDFSQLSIESRLASAKKVSERSRKAVFEMVKLYKQINSL